MDRYFKSCCTTGPAVLGQVEEAMTSAENVPFVGAGMAAAPDTISPFTLRSLFGVGVATGLTVWAITKLLGKKG